MEIYDSAGLSELNLPVSIEAEQSVLGAILIESSCLMTAMEYLKPDSFYRSVNRVIFTAMLSLFASGRAVDFVTVLELVKTDEVFENEQGAKTYLINLMEIVPSVSNIEHYLRIVKDKHYLRSLSLAAREIIEDTSGGEEASVVLDRAEQRIYDIRQGRETSGLKSIKELIISAYDRLQRMSALGGDEFLGISTGFRDLDRYLHGLNGSDLVLIAGRPGMGKTTFAVNIAEKVAQRGKKVAIFTLEMSGEQIVMKLLSDRAGINSQSFRTGRLEGGEWVTLARTAQELSENKIFVDDSAGISVPEMKAKLRRMQGLDLVVIDYLQLMTSGGRKTDNRVQEVSEITRGLKIMAKELDVPIITCSQLSRGPEGRQDHRPALSDLRESGSIEQDADIVMLLYRPAYYDQDNADRYVAECIIAKNRHGETGTVPLAWNGQYSRFSDLEQSRNDY